MSYLFKIDSYFSLISGRCPNLQIEELDVNLPSTFALWNAHGLDEFYKRHPQEPIPRVGVRLFDFLRRPELLDPSAWLVEDVNIGLCGMHRAVWRYNMTRQNGGVVEPNYKDQLAKQLDFWRVKLDKVSNLCDTPQSQAQGGDSLLRFYLGGETEGSPSTRARVRSLLHDTEMLYNIIGLYLYSDTHLLTRFAMTPAASTVDTPTSTRSSQANNARVKEWVHSPDGKTAITFCMAVLKARENIRPQDIGHYRPAESLEHAAVLDTRAVLEACFVATEDSDSCMMALYDSYLLNLETLD